MPLTALALVLAAALCHACWNLMAKKSGGGDAFMLLTALMVTVLWAPLAWWVGQEALPQWALRDWAVVGASAALHVAYFRCLLHGYRVADLSVVYPVARGSGPLLATLGAVLVLGESLSALGTLGVALVVVGVMLIAGGPKLWQATHAQDPQQRQRALLGVGWGALTGVFIASYTVVDAYAVKVLLLAPLLVDYLGNVLRLPMIAPLLWRLPGGPMAALHQSLRTQWRAALAVAVLGPMSYIMVLTALQWAPLSLVAPAREVSMLLGALLGGTLLGEQDRWSRLCGAALVGCGVVSLAAGVAG
ncbi:EamA family transporter [Roseateles sp. BYS180W]|uniref:EamA family transporter n=1 Tax=Roseateles rivi TaxID=3299028 RepID=A0ABW7FWZ4_9BURK